ncbi:MAG TPA: phosphatidylglycerophosphatase A [Xanthomonadales bacterium]|nr:phosphatidylglycerophosphatase A [Xanthomonadales bacterium]
MIETETTPGDVTLGHARDGESIQQRARQLALHTPDGFLAFGFGSGLLTSAPGTLGTLAAVPVAVLVSALGISPWLFLPLTFLVGIWLCNRATRALEVDDYGGIVWDEMVGYWLVVSFFPLHWTWLAGAFVLFRGFDILKPWPISLVESSFDGGLGIMLDDVAAAVYAIVVLKFIQTMVLGG